ncbi:helix-turn-helix domain-containing protein [Facklamia sp. 7083-14-GEN3]|uniref:helix-turn-helix domain-containing protein n=1 Tax=Facklamia sp. 7083-14-GEN3 TaxID=2973478 RepID=UPI00215BCA63|nr:AraC family transcriptional regulator [Facklamia sp. 7083-14-GEN3]MCR8969539.1 AraC family transcriptional regulator [Facklamia sp. 7083-14-GEN3]
MYISNINSASVKLDGIQSEKITASQRFTIESSDKLVLIYVHKGAADFISGEKIGNFKKRDIIILNPNHSIDIQPIRKLEWIRVEISGILFTSSAEIESMDNIFIVSDHSQTIKNYLDLALIEYEQPFRGSEIVLRKLIECVMVHVLRHHELSIKDSSIQVRHQEIEMIKEYIREHFSEKVTLEQLSDIVDINKYYMIRLFKQQTGLSPIDYLIHVRLSEAEKLLAQTSITISKISDIVGFHSPSHFSKTFKESNHMTPSAYRRKFSNLV